MRFFLIFGLVLFCSCVVADDPRFDWEEDSSKKQALPIPLQPPASAPGVSVDPFLQMQRRMLEMQKRMEKQFGSVYGNFDPFGPFDTFQNRAGSQNPFPQTSQTNRWFSNDLKVLEKKHFVIVEVPVRNKRIDAFDVKVQGRFLRITEKTSVKEKHEGKEGRRSFSSFQAHSRSTLLPAEVEPRFSKAIVKGKLVITFKKKNP